MLRVTVLVLLTVGTLTVAGCTDPAPHRGAAPPPPAVQSSNPGPGAAPPVPVAGGPGTQLAFITFASQKSATDPGGWGPVLTEIEAHLPTSYGNQYYDSDRITHAHETTHGINSHLRNYLNTTGKKANGLYVLEDRGVLVEEPNVRKSAVAAFVPAALRGSRFSLYLQGMQAWDDMPTYIFDEWVAYTNGAVVGVDRVSRGLWKEGWRDGVMGPLEFTVYGIATGMAVEKGDPQYFASNQQFRELIAWQAARAMDVFRAGRNLPDFAWATQNDYYAKLQSDPGAQPIRDFLTRTYGAGFAKRVLGLPGGDPGPGDGGPAPADSGVQPKPDSSVQPKLDAGAPKPGDAGAKPQLSDAVQPAPPPLGDEDHDGVPNAEDRCSRTASGQPVWSAGKWKGCAGGQYLDADDGDRDGVPDLEDGCSRTAPGQPVWLNGPWKGCAAGEFRDR